MKPFFTLLFSLALALPGLSQPIKQTGWTTTTNPAVARAALGVNTNGDVYINQDALTNNNAAAVTLQSNLTAVQFIGSGKQLTNVPVTAPSALQLLLPRPPLCFDTFYNDASNPSLHNEANVLLIANKWKTNGMYAAGYTTFRISDGWQMSTRDANGDLQWDSASRFPSGSNLVTQLHNLGYKVGLYSSYDRTFGLTCVGVAGSTRETIYRDMKKFAQWGVDYVFMDACGSGNNPTNSTESFKQDIRENIRIVANAVMESGRPMALHIVGGGNLPFEVTQLANSYQLGWNGGFDNPATFQSAGEFCTTPAQVMTNARTALVNSNYYGPGHYLWIGTENFNNTTNLIHFNMTMHALFGTVVAAGNFFDSQLVYMTNSEVLAIHQDDTLFDVQIASSNALHEVWYRPIGLFKQTNAVALINTGATNAAITCAFTNLGFSAGTVLKVRDVWAKSDIGIFTNSFTQTITSDNVGFYRLSPVGVDVSSGGGVSIFGETTFGTRFKETNVVTVTANSTISSNVSAVIVNATTNTTQTLPANSQYGTVWVFNGSTNTVTLARPDTSYLFFNANTTYALTNQGQSAGIFIVGSNIWIK